MSGDILLCFYTYFCTVFFMVLDLRLSKKIGMSGDILLCFYTLSASFIRRIASLISSVLMA